MEEAEEKCGFKVTDKRRFTPEGEAKPETEVHEQVSATKKAQDTVEQAKETSSHAKEQKAEPLPPIDFTGFILSLANTAFFQLGLVRANESDEIKKDLPGARQTIDILGMLEQKTRGNLTEQEATILKNVLFQLRMAFVEAAK